MRRIIYILILTLPNFLFGQKVVMSKSECDNYNKFLEGSKLHDLKELSDSIYPSGKIYLDVERDVQFRELESFTPFLELGNDYSLQYLSTRVSRFDKNIEFRRYEQYFKGVKVEGGGVTAAYRIPGDGPDGPNGPCDELYMLSPYLFTEIDISVNPDIYENQLPSIVGSNLSKQAELVIENNLLGNCSYSLVWRVLYNDGSPKLSWISAHDGTILKTINSRINLNAPTVTYGTQMLNDDNQGGTTFLRTPDGRITSYDFFSTVCPSDPLVESEWTNDLIPTTSNSEWTTEALEEVYQAFYVTSEVDQAYQSIGIVFGNINVSSCSIQNAFSIRGSTIEDAYIMLGQLGSDPLSLVDVVAHELGHTYLNDFLNYSNFGGNATLHEGISDIIGTYIESLIQGIDWVMGDDEPNVANHTALQRNLEIPRNDCLATAPFQQHERGLVLGHWYYLMTTGGNPAIGLNTGINVVLEALNLVGRDASVNDFMNATITVVEENYGRCSSEFVAINNAWENICVETGYGLLDTNPCDFKISGPSWVCEEANYANFCIDGGLPTNFWNWTIIGNKSTEFTSVRGMQGNGQNGGQCLTLIDFPDYPYYPQYITISVWSSINQKEVRKRVKILDCDGDDPTCEEYYGLNIAPSQSEEIGLEGIPRPSFETNHSNEYKIHVFDLYGRSKFEGIESEFDPIKLTLQNRIYILVKFDNFGRITSSDKILIIH